MEKKTSVRQVNFEFLRIIAMIMVVFLHALSHGGVLEYYKFGSLGYIFFWFIETICYVAVNIFVLITGYFMCFNKMKLSKIIKVIIQVEFYSLLGTFIGTFFLKENLSMKDLFWTIFPITNETYWFVTHYIILLVLVPLLNKFIYSLSKREFIFALVLLIFSFSVIPNIFFWSRNILGTGYNFIWFIVLYCIAAYIRLYDFKLSKNVCILGYLFFVVGALLSRLLIGSISTKILGKEIGSGLFYTYNSVIILLASVSLFLFYKQIEIKSKIFSKVISEISLLSFGVYLFHEHFILRNILWEFVNFSKIIEYGIIVVFVYMLGIIFLIFITGCVIEAIRNKILNLLGLKKFLDWCDMYTKKFLASK